MIRELLTSSFGSGAVRSSRRRRIVPTEKEKKDPETRQRNECRVVVFDDARNTWHRVKSSPVSASSGTSDLADCS
ncbi:hypothetical protein TNCV_4655641 [Trichonephila clavipes]|nr:hypothetical protein TNCV_4655641 [Trichonephila clavipes]